MSEEEIDPLIKRLKRQDKQIELLKAKLFTLQAALVRSSHFSTYDLDHPFASVAPIVSRFFPDTQSTVIAFGGIATSLSMPPAEFLRTFTNKKVNTIFVKDFKQCWYQQGLLGLSDSIQETVEIIKKQLPENQKNIYTIGTSAGGYAAILFGALLGADKIVAFAPQTILTKPIFRKFKSLESKQGDIDFDGEFANLKKLLGTLNFNGSIHIHYGQKNIIDKAEAEHLAHLQYVHLHPWETNSHVIAGWLKKQDKLNCLLDETFGFSDQAVI